MGLGPAARPISQYVLKVHSRCDLACDHCYIYEHADQSWRSRPHRIADATVRQAAARIARHAAAHRLPEVHVVLHGGEPLLLGPRGLRDVLGPLREQIAPVARLDLSIHTNGVLLNEELCDLFSEQGVRVGVSLDGDRAANDRHRRHADGRSSHDAVLRALWTLRSPRYRHLYAGILCTIDIANDPIAVYEALLAEEPPRIDFLLPHATWDNPPPRPGAAAAAAPYARWLGRILERWDAAGRPVPIRLFESIEAALRGEPSGSEGVGLDPVDLLVIETDGSWEQVDSLKTAYQGAAATQLDVFTHSVDDAALFPAVAARQQGLDALCATCRRCPVVEGCGGGLYSHRYRSGSGFDNPSVYCEDLKELVGRVAAVSRAAAAVHPTRTRSARPSATDTPPEPPQPPELPQPAVADVERLAEGPAGADLAERFAEAQADLTRNLFAQVAAEATEAGAWNPVAIEGWDLLCSLDERRPVAAQRIYRHPHARAWAVRCIAALRGDGRESGAVDRHLMRLAVFAAAGAIHAGQDAALVVPVDAGRLHLPGLGTRVFEGCGDAPIRFEVRAGETQGGGVRLPARTASGLLLEDQDPYRDCYGAPPTGPLGDAEVTAWDQAVTGALSVLRRTAPGYAAQVRAVLRAIVPLVADPAGAPRAAASRDSYGAIGLDGGGSLAALLVRETQRMLLGAVLDLHDLVDSEDRRRLRVSGSPELRPAADLLSDAFTHLGLAEARPDRDDPATESAAPRHAERCAAALGALRSAAVLTPLGERFAARLAERAQAVASVPRRTPGAVPE